MNQHLHSPTKLTEFARDFEDEPDTLFGRFVNKIQNAYNQGYNTVNEVSNTNQAQVSKSVFYADATTRPAATSATTANMGVSSSNSTSSVGGEKVLITRNNSSSSVGSSKPQPPHTLPVRASSVLSSSSMTTGAEDSASETNEKVDTLPIESEGRTMVNVLKRLSNIVASKNSDLRHYKDTDLQRFWMPDAKAKECYDCAQKFSTFRRKHHCRLCGQIFCSKCCNQVVPGKIIMCSGDLKVCNYCSKIVLSYLKSPDIAVDLHSDLQALQQDLSSKLEDTEDASKTSALPTRSNLVRKESVGYQEERFASSYKQNALSLDARKNILQQSNSLITLHDEMRRALPPQNCGTDLIEFLNAQNKSSNKMQALAILSAMLAAGFLTPIVPDSEQAEFDENLHYKFMDLPRHLDVDSISYKEFTKLSEVPSPQFDASDEPQPPKSIDTSLSYPSVQDIELEHSSSKLLESYCDHEEQLLAQMLRTFQLDLRWAAVLQPLCCRAANYFKPEYCTNDLMDIRNYVNFKKVPGGKRQECTIVGGVVFSKNVAHKDMATRVERPRILLLQCPIVYERVEGKFVSIATVLLQEKEYLGNVCARIMSFKPNVVLVHKNVAGVAQDMLRSHGITLVIDVKLSVMERLARTLQCDILTSIDSNLAKPKLGICDAFYIRSFSDGSGTSKTLMYFEKLTSPRGYTCLLRGGSNKELAKVKKVALFLVYARYNWRLEMSFLLDEFAQPLAPQPPIFDSKEPSPEDGPELRATATTSKRIGERKSEDKIVTAVSENVADFTDPLRSMEAPHLDLTLPDDTSVLALEVEMRYDNRFRNALSSTILSVSPFLTFPLPYLETEQGRKCALRHLFPAELYFSKQFSNTNSSNNNNAERRSSHEALKAVPHESQLNPPHPFLKLKITKPIDNRELQTLLAEFRALGGRYPKKKKMFKLLKRQDSYQRPQKLSDDHVFKDALDLENHQRLPVLFCSFYFNPKSASSFCAPPTLLDMKFYGQQDIMLGQFLQRYCCRLNSICTLCNLPMLGHVRRYVHSMGCVQVFLSEDATKTDPNRIYFTAWCTICNEVTPTVPLSETTKCLSFAKYLELRFHGHAYQKRTLESNASSSVSSSSTVAPEDSLQSQSQAKCQHSLHRDYVHYFTYRGVGAKFQYTPIEVWEIGLPALTLNLLPAKPFDHFEVLEEIKNFSMRGHEVYNRIHERIADLAIEDENSPLVANLNPALSKDQFHFKQYVEIVQTLLTMPKATPYDLNDALLMAKRVLAESIELWGPRLHEIALAQKMAAKQQQQQQQQPQQQQQHPPQHDHHTDAGTVCTEDLRSEHSDISPTCTDAPRLPASDSVATDDTHDESDTPLSGSGSGSGNGLPLPMEKKASSDHLPSYGSDKKSIKKMLIHLLPSTSSANLLQSPFNSHEHYTLPLGAFPIMVHDQDLSSVIAYSLTVHDYQKLVANLNSPQSTAGGGNGADANNAAANNNHSSSFTNPSPNLRRKAHEDLDDVNSKGSNTSFHSGSNSNSNEEERTKCKTNSSHVEVAFQDHSTQFTCKIYFAKEFDLMRAKTLKPPKPVKSLFKEQEHNKRKEDVKVSSARSGPELELIRKASDAASTLTGGLALKLQADANAPKDTNVQLQSDIEDCRNFLARSLCSSVQWEARGGKSGSRFCKTSDDRFVLKEMTKGDISIFESFAPNYFDYIRQCQQQQQPTLLAKIFGVFKVTVKKKDFTQEKSLLVMENLFYNCDIRNKFDLKGSERNRLVDPTNQHGEIVLLDENLVQMSWSKPLYILSHSKAVLRDAINRDSSFLEKNQVMDYSLLVGLDNDKGTLVLGIIDYIRTFTFDKKVESFVKQTGLLGGMGKLPTVISPERYKQRFTDAMDKYFYTVPDRWEGLSKI